MAASAESALMNERRDERGSMVWGSFLVVLLEDNGEVVGGDLDSEVVSDGVNVLGDGYVAGGVAEAAGAVLRDEVGGDEDGIGVRQEIVWIVCGGIEGVFLLLGGSSCKNHYTHNHYCKDSE